MTATTTSTSSNGHLPIVLLGLAEMAELLPVSPQTVYRWRVPRGKSATAALPEPMLVVSSTPLWAEDVVLDFAESRGLKPDRKVLARIRRDQGHR